MQGTPRLRRRRDREHLGLDDAVNLNYSLTLTGTGYR